MLKHILHEAATLVALGMLLALFALIGTTVSACKLGVIV